MQGSESPLRHPLTQTILGALLGTVATFAGTYYGFQLTVRHELEKYRQDIVQSRIDASKREDAHASALVMQLQLNQRVAANNLRKLEVEIRNFPSIRDLIPLAPLLEIQELGPGVRFPGVIGLDPMLRKGALQIMLDVRAVNGSIAVREELKRSQQFSSLAFDGSRLSDPRPGDSERDSLNRYLRALHSRVTAMSITFVGRYDSLVHGGGK